MKHSIPQKAMVKPLARTEILIDANSARHMRLSCEVRENDGQMPRFSNHRILTIAAALTIPTRMHMHIGNYYQVQFAALFPHKPEPSAVELNNAVLEARWIDIVVIQKFLYPPNPALNAAEKKGSAFACPPCALHQLINTIIPGSRIAEQPRLLAESYAQ
jgi:hypothetical protein